MGAPGNPPAPSPPLVMAAGSLAGAMDALIAAHAEQDGQRFAVGYGPSGMLRQEMASGKKADVFASASVDHAQALAALGLLGAPRVFAHNELCVLARPGLALTADNFLDVLSRPEVRLATSTPASDPMGDYTWQFFRKADRKQPGLYRLFDGKALRLSGTLAPPAGTRSPYLKAFEEDAADAYIMYRTNALSVRLALPELDILPIPPALGVRSAYGIAARPGSDAGRRFIAFVLQPQGQAILRQYGFL